MQAADDLVAFQLLLQNVRKELHCPAGQKLVETRSMQKTSSLTPIPVSPAACTPSNATRMVSKLADALASLASAVPADEGQHLHQLLSSSFRHTFVCQFLIQDGREYR